MGSDAKVHVSMLACVECRRSVEETWDDRCGECFYIYTGGDQGEDDWWSRHAVVREGTIYAEFKPKGGQSA